MGEVKAQTIGRDERSLLLDMQPKRSPQRRMHKVGCGVIQNDPAPALCVNVRNQRLPEAKFTLRDIADVQDLIATHLRIRDPEFHTVIAQCAGITNLTPGLAIKWREIENHNARFFIIDRLHRDTARIIKPDNSRFAPRAIIAGELDFAVRVYFLVES
jgi:hypothetical protein